jgi:deoxyribonuclease V
MNILELHSWDCSPTQAVALQRQLAGRVRLTVMPDLPHIVAGLDCAFSRDKKRIAAAAVVLRLGDFKVLETAEAVMEVRFPYVPGLLSFREAPACLAAMRKLQITPDVVLVDGQGIAHPRRLGLASHLGLFLDCPTIGCAKSRLIGTYQDPSKEKGACSLLMDKDHRIGSVLRTRQNVKPLFVSPGHKVTHEQAIEIVMACCTRYRLPEPTRLAHQRVTAFSDRTNKIKRILKG